MAKKAAPSNEKLAVFLEKPFKASPLTPRRRVVRETSHADGMRELHLDCGHTCVTRDHTVVLETPCLLCIEQVE